MPSSLKKTHVGVSDEIPDAASASYVELTWLGKFHVEYALVGCYCSFHRKHLHVIAVKAASAFTFSYAFVFYGKYQKKNKYIL